MRIRKSTLVILLSLSFMLTLSIKKIYSNEGVVTIKLPKGVSMEIPKDWIVASGATKFILQTLNESFLDLQNMETDKVNLEFFAAYIDKKEKVAAKVIATYKPDGEITQSEVQVITEDQVAVFDNGRKKSVEQGIISMGGELKSWGGTQKIVINGIATLITEYTYFNSGSKQTNTVRLVSVLNGKNTFSLTISYRENERKTLRPICDNIINSLKVAGL